MKDLKKKEMKKDVYEEEIIRISYIAGNEYRQEEKELIRLFSKLGYTWYNAKLYEVRPTLFKEKTTCASDDYLNNKDNAFNKITVFENKNHQIILTKYCTIIRTKDGQKHLDGLKPVFKFLRHHIVELDSTKLIGVTFEASTIDYINDINEVEKRYKGVFVETEIKEEYNIKRETNKDYYQKGRTAESYSSKTATQYFYESGMCYDKEMDFSTAEYYDERVARLKINIGVSYYYKDTKLSKYNFEEVIKELEEKQFELFLNSHKDEYKEILI